MLCTLYRYLSAWSGLRPFLPGLAALLLLGSGTASALDDAAFGDALKSLNVRSYQAKEAAITHFATLDDERVEQTLQALLEGNLYTRAADGRFVVAEEQGGKFRLTDAIDGASRGVVGRFDVKKVRINNHLRGVLHEQIARINLASVEPARRLKAVKELTGDTGANTAKLLREAAVREDDGAVRQAIAVALALIDLHADDKAVRLQAIATLDGSVAEPVRVALRPLVGEADDGTFNEPDADVRLAATRVLRNIESKLELYGRFETVFFGLSLGSVLLLSAIGLAITFGVMGVINMAHGEMMMLGAYTTYVIQQLMPNHIAISVMVAIPAAFLVAGLVGVVIERGIIRFLYGRPLETLLATFGLSLALQQLVRTLFSPLNRSVSTPEWMSGSWAINSALSLTYNRLYIILFSLVVFAALLVILKKTSLGLKVRAVSQNRTMARAMGIRADWVDAMTFGLGSGIAGVAGVALSQLTNVGPNLGQSYIIDSFMVVVFGGVGNLWGTLVGAFSLGVANKVLEPYAGAVLGKILVLLFIILFIQKRPRGLFPQKGRFAEE